MKINTTNLAALKEGNLSLVIRTIRERGNCSRTELANATGLKQATITKIITQLMEWGLVKESESYESPMGRKPIGLVIDSGQYLVLTARIQRTEMSVAVFDISGNRYGLESHGIDMLNGAPQAFSMLKQMISRAIEGVDEKPLAISLALPGPFNYKTQRIALMSNFPGWDPIDMRSELEEAYGVPVYLEHDANCAALAEKWYGEHQESECLMYVAAAEGIGAGIVVGGQILRGMQGFAGEIGHMSINMYGPQCDCGNRGCLELYTTLRALEEEYKRQEIENAGREEVYRPAAEILKMVREGSNQSALLAFERVVSILGFGMVSAINAINPDVVIFGDSLTLGGESNFLRIINRMFQKHLMGIVYRNMSVKVSRLPDDPMLLGAGAVAFEGLLKEPSRWFSGAEKDRQSSIQERCEAQ